MDIHLLYYIISASDIELINMMFYKNQLYEMEDKCKQHFSTLKKVPYQIN